MKYVKLGRSGLEVSRICLGCMAFGAPERGNPSWTLGEEQSRPVMRAAVEAGINFFDTANIYSDGSSEEILGKLLKEMIPRDEAVLATKVAGATREGPNSGGLSRKVIMAHIDASLQRLGTDYVDLYQIHRFDHFTPMEETLEALNDVVRAGKARYIGASSMFAWQFVSMLNLSQANGWAGFISMQNHLNLLYREEEREMLPLCGAKGVGVIPWSPLARGRLARKDAPATARSRDDPYATVLYGASEEADRRVLAQAVEVADGRGEPMARVALAWVLQSQAVAAPIVGASRTEHVDDAVAALGIELAAAELAKLEACYVPHAVAGI